MSAKHQVHASVTSRCLGCTDRLCAAQTGKEMFALFTMLNLSGQSDWLNGYFPHVTRALLRRPSAWVERGGVRQGMGFDTSSAAGGIQDGHLGKSNPYASGSMVPGSNYSEQVARSHANVRRATPAALLTRTCTQCARTLARSHACAHQTRAGMLLADNLESAASIGLAPLMLIPSSSPALCFPRCLLLAPQDDHDSVYPNF